MNPTHYELATIAATMSRAGDTPAATATHALDLWKACGKALAEAAQVAAHCDEYTQRITSELAPLEGLEPYTTEKLLRAAMPNSKPEDRAKKFRDYIRRNIAFHNNLDGDELEAVLAQTLERDRQGNLHQANAEATFLGFTRYLAADRKAANVARAKKGAAAKKSLGQVAEPTKPPQAKRKPPQAKR